MIISENKLQESTTGMNLVSGEMKINNNYVVVDKTEQEFIDFCRENGIKVIFYYYTYYSKDKYLVTDEILRDNTDNDDEYNFCKEWADLRNKDIDALDFSRPMVLTMAASLGAMILICQERDEWMTDFAEGEAAMEIFIEENEDKMLDLFDVDSDGISLVDELQKQLLADPVFRNSTNKDSRRLFLKTFIKKKENKKYLRLVKEEKRSWNKVYALSVIVDRIYNEYRNACYKAKVQVGGELPKDE